MPEGAVYVGRGSRWGNPWIAGRYMFLTGKKKGQWMNEKDAVVSFRNTLQEALRTKPEVRAGVEQLQGKNLLCWCALDQPCHADVLLEIANGGHNP